MFIYKPLRRLLATLVIILHPALIQASEYPIEPVDSLCQGADDPEKYTTGKLKSMRYLVEGSPGWVYRSEDDFLTNFREDAEYTNLRSLVDLLSSKGISLLIAYLPTRGLMKPAGIPEDKFDYERALASYRKKLHVLAQTGAIVPDLSQMLADNDSEEFFFERDIHWTPTGAKKTARLVGRAIRKSGLVQEQPNFKVSNEPGPLYTIRSGLSAGIKSVCGELFPIQYVRGYVFTAHFEESGEDLFAEDPEAEVVLLGTSFSALQPLNFAGFLQEEIEAPVVNFAMPAGGDKGAWLKFLGSDESHSTSTKLIIWEVPGYYLLDDPELFAQIVPMLGQTLTRENIVLEQDVRLVQSDRPHTSLFFSDKIVDLPLSELVLELQLSDPEINEIKFTLWYRDGSKKKEIVRVPQRARMEGHFVFSLFGNLLSSQTDLVGMELTQVGSQSINEYLQLAQKESLDVNIKVYRTVH